MKHPNYALAQKILKYGLKRRGYTWSETESEAALRVMLKPDWDIDACRSELWGLVSRLEYMIVNCSKTYQRIELLPAVHPTPAQRAGVLIAVEGLDKVGKSTFANELWLHLEAHKDIVTKSSSAISAHSTRFGGLMGGSLRAPITRPTDIPSPAAEQLAILAGRADQWDKHIIPYLAGHSWVISDRHDLSCKVYRRPEDNIEALKVSEAAYGLNTPADITFILDLASDHPRRGSLNQSLDPLESREPGFWGNARTKFLDLADTHPNTFVLNADFPTAELVKTAMQHIEYQFLSSGS